MARFCGEGVKRIHREKIGRFVSGKREDWAKSAEAWVGKTERRRLGRCSLL